MQFQETGKNHPVLTEGEGKVDHWKRRRTANSDENSKEDHPILRPFPATAILFFLSAQQ